VLPFVSWSPQQNVALYKAGPIGLESKKTVKKFQSTKTIAVDNFIDMNKWHKVQHVKIFIFQ
jgi:hypothetical protein